MKSYLKLVHFEISRFFKLYLILIGLTVVSQLIGAVIVSKGYMSSAEKVMYANQLSVSKYIEQSAFSFSRFINSEWFVMPIVFCIAMLMIYVFFIWYRDWFGKNTFIYRLLMLPTERINIYFAKLTTIMLLVLGLITLQILLVPIEMQIVNGIVPADFRTNFPFYGIYDQEIWGFLYPNTPVGFILLYGIGLIFVAILFTSILFERSFGLKGIFCGIVYGMFSFGVLVAPLILAVSYTGYFYPLEIYLMELVTSIIVLGSAIWIANHLLKHKIRV
ncbi:hypothetical protein AEA09_10405 [Lysinibacillus contaminans]|uniref:ABC transporter permease n=1 Tax=Lysinibacillus contaminans TaxID=1293441 RepID=A0ABR5K220_9BACI|nr:hypothetical protein [Lysinibacillus contaminans]KOS68914.1 hypothetical protein AEA09_10405 [Lysinibacillus contaminans]